MESPREESPVRTMYRKLHTDRWSSRDLSQEQAQALHNTNALLSNLQQFERRNGKLPENWPELGMNEHETFLLIKENDDGEVDQILLNNLPSPRMIIPLYKKFIAGEQLDEGAQAEHISPETYEAPLQPEAMESYANDLVQIFNKGKERVIVNKALAQNTIAFFRALAQELRDSDQRLNTSRVERMLIETKLPTTNPTFAGVTQENQLAEVTIFRNSEDPFPIDQMFAHVQRASERARKMVEAIEKEETDRGELK